MLGIELQITAFDPWLRRDVGLEPFGYLVFAHHQVEFSVFKIDVHCIAVIDDRDPSRRSGIPTGCNP